MLDFIGFLFMCPLEVVAENLRKAGLTSDLLSILCNFIHNEQICHTSCAVLWSLAVSEIAAFRFITDSKGSGINLIKDAYHFYCDDPQVVESICVLINEMVQYDDVMVDMLSQQMEKLLSEIKSRFPSSLIQILSDQWTEVNV
ncbi:hypothetical protein CIB84_013579 [Bambusicola thoracicus]|uniref:non-specific serine/threonine protein kinase n=1 Tax=Bambusicola thoracicus TaxID=9083 RepID=A0A2P4SEY7_BAMTH|nr:hypothetical protein CIB84_013579 [Bambusicola thoracicus]